MMSFELKVDDFALAVYESAMKAKSNCCQLIVLKFDQVRFDKSSVWAIRFAGCQSFEKFVPVTHIFWAAKFTHLVGVSGDPLSRDQIYINLQNYFAFLSWTTTNIDSWYNHKIVEI